MLTPLIQPPFPLRWGFSTRHTDATLLPPRTLAQIHGCLVWEASEKLKEGDGHWTMRPGHLIGVRVADCAPVLLAGPTKGGKPWVAALHAGWKGAVAGILRVGVHAFKDQGGRVEDLVFAFGPCIQKCHFEVGQEVVEAARQDAAWREELAEPRGNGKSHLDLHGLLRSQALELGMDPVKDGSLPRCTYCEPESFYSYRRGEREERQWGIIEILRSQL